MQRYTLGRQIAVVARLWRIELDRRLQPCGLSQARYVLMVLLAEAADNDVAMNQQDLAERADIAGATLVRHLDLLESAGLVARRDAPGDRRVKHVVLTDAGRRAVAEADRIASSLRDGLTAGFPPEEVETMHRILQGLGTALEATRATNVPAAASDQA